MAVADTRRLWVTANLKETQLNRVRIGQPVAITVDAPVLFFTALEPTAGTVALNDTVITGLGRGELEF